MTICFARPAEIDQWNTLILANPDTGNVFQGAEFAEQKRMGGWTPRYIMADTIAITALEKSVPGLGKLWYLPKGPGITSVSQLDDLLSDLAVFAKQHNVFVIKIEPELPDSNETRSDFLKLGLVKVTPVQPNFSTIKLDISTDLDTVMASLNQKGRHAIKRAERDGATAHLVESSDENCELMYKLLASTAEGSFRIRKYQYYKTFWQRYSAVGRGQLFFAYVDGKIVAGAYAVIFGSKSTYKDGASVRERTVYGASHLLQWRVIEWAKANGSVIHDFCGSPPANEIKNADHPHYGIGRFKTSFNKEVTDYIGAWDFAINEAKYKMWSKIGERLIVRLHNKRHNENWY
ncbi:MAG: putative Methicillin resistance protein [Candidatus Saccharibacteria bacterium]|jgi:lipid II:glycine glycyltransferase (peptidoglycan interpeptide bridge formation enzyme)|nr:putative Methicillin resistance protein [Candidatus Saccharibacteria bacterium]